MELKSTKSFGLRVSRKIPSSVPRLPLLLILPKYPLSGCRGRSSSDPHPSPTSLEKVRVLTKGL